MLIINQLAIVLFFFVSSPDLGFVNTFQPFIFSNIIEFQDDGGAIIIVQEKNNNFEYTIVSRNCGNLKYTLYSGDQIADTRLLYNNGKDYFNYQVTLEYFPIGNYLMEVASFDGNCYVKKEIVLE